VEVPIIRFSKWLQDHVLSRELPADVHGAYAKNATIVVKLDIEGSEYVVLPDLISSGALCELDYVFGEFHPYSTPNAFPDSGVDLSTRQKTNTFKNAILSVISGLHRTCKVRYEDRDDETYLHNGIPLPTPTKV